MKKLSAIVCVITFAFILSSPIYSQNQIVSKLDAKASATEKKSPAPVTVEKIEGDVAEALSIIQNNHVMGKKINYNDVFKASIDAMLHTLDPHSNYFDPKEFEEFRTDQNSRYYGIGATIGDLSDPKGKVIGTYIRATFDGAPANRAGLRYGDKIVEVNGKNVLGMAYPDVRELLRGPRGTIAKLVVERFGTGQIETVEIIRDAVSQPSISEAYMIRPGVGYIVMSGGFNSTTYAEFASAMKFLKTQGMTQLVIDLKNNGGGLVIQSYKVANTFLEAGQTVFTQKGRLDGTTEPFLADNRTPETMPVIVLVNRYSASASEILAGALQDHDRALIVGETTFGKGLVQNPFILDYNTMLLLTIAKYETPSGRLIQRDYSNGDLYDYYTKGGISDDGDSGKHTGPESKTDSGRTVYSGGGINPDVAIKPETIPIERARGQLKLINPVFAFALNVTHGKIKGFDEYVVNKPIVFNHDVTDKEFAFTDNLFNAFKSFAVKEYGVSAELIDKEKEFIARSLRTEIVSAAYGFQTSLQVTNEYDKQLLKAIDLMPEARKLALEGKNARAAGANAKHRQ